MSSASERAKAELQRAMAQRLIRELRSADGMESFKYRPDGKRLAEYHFAPEHMRWIADVLERALNGDPDPLQLRPRCRKPEYPMRHLESAAAMALLLHHAMEEARAQIPVELALFWAAEDRRSAAAIIRDHAARQ